MIFLTKEYLQIGGQMENKKYEHMLLWCSIWIQSVDYIQVINTWGKEEMHWLKEQSYITEQWCFYL